MKTNRPNRESTTSTNTTPKGQKTVKRSGAKNPISPELKEKCDQIRGLLIAADTSLAEKHHAIGVVVLAVTADKGKYGKSVVSKIALALGCSGSLLYACADVAHAWPRFEFDALLKKRNSKNRPLSFWHFVELAQPKAAAKRDELLEKALERSWSVAQLAHEVAQQPTDSSAQDSDAAHVITRAGKVSVAFLQKLQAVLEELQAGITAETAGTVSPAALDTADKSFEAVVEKVNQIRAELATARAALPKEVTDAA